MIGLANSSRNLASLPLIGILLFFFCLALPGCNPIQARSDVEALDDLDRLERIDPIPLVEYFIRKDRYAEADEYLAFFMDYEYVSEDPRARELKQHIDATRGDWTRKLKKLNGGFFTGESDEIEGKAGAILSDFLVVGDLRDLAKEWSDYVVTGEFDNGTVALAGIGTILTAAAVIPPLTPKVVPAKSGVSFLKYMHRSVGLPRWLRESIVSNLKNPSQLVQLLGEVYESYKAAGVRSTLMLLSKARDLEDFRMLASMGKQYGMKTATLIKATDGAAIEAFRHLGSVSKEMLLEAGTYGKAGIEKIEKYGPEKFAESFRRRLSNVELDFVRSGREATVAGKRVVYRNQTFLPNVVDGKGVTNLDRMRMGQAPIGKDGMTVELHHLKQRDAGTIIEMTGTEHRREWSPLFHRYSRQSEIKRPVFDEWRVKEYWKWRAANLG